MTEQRNLLRELSEANVLVTGLMVFPQPYVMSEVPEHFEDTTVPEAILKMAEDFGWDDNEIGDLREGDYAAWDALNDQIMNNGKSIAIIFASKPVVRDGSYSWGYRHLESFAADTVEAALEAAVQWGDA